MFFDSNLQVALGFASVTSITACTNKLVNKIGLKKFRRDSLQLKKLPIFNGKNATTILVFLQYLSQSLILVAFEKVPTYSNLEYILFYYYQ